MPCSNALKRFNQQASLTRTAISSLTRFLVESKGAKLTDLDGNVYTDYWCTHLAVILGHRHPTVLEAIKLQAEKGWHHGFVHELEVTHAEAITRHVPSAEMVRYASSGSEANFFAVRLARTFTKTTKIAKFEGGWHGPCDPLHIAMNSPSTNFHREVLRKARNKTRSSSRSMTLMVSKTV